MRTIVAGGLLGALIAVLVASPASAQIVPQRGIAGVMLEMTRAEVIDAKGEPDAERVVDAEIFGRQRIMRYGRTRVLFGGHQPRRARVVAVITKDRRERTRHGVGIRSRERQVRRRIARVRCRTEFGTRRCVRGRFRPGQRVTVFELNRRGGRVTSVTVGFVID